MKAETRARLTRLEAKIESLQTEVAALRAQQRQISAAAANYVSAVAAGTPGHALQASQFGDFLMTVVGGKEAPAGFLDECAAIGRLDARLGGSGVLISPRIVLTAAHCGQKGNHPDPTVAALPLTVIPPDASKVPPAEANPGDFIANPKFTGQGANDIAVLVLDKDCTVTPVPLASTAEMIAATEVTVAGFGQDDPGATIGFGTKRSAVVPIQFLAGGPSNLIPAPAQPDDFDHDLEFLVGTGGMGACMGDSGGPVYIDVAGQRKVAGIVVRAPSNQSPPCQGLTICTRVDVFAAWIASLTP